MSSEDIRVVQLDGHGGGDADHSQQRLDKGDLAWFPPSGCRPCSTRTRARCAA
jgi:hypothetical protein